MIDDLPKFLDELCVRLDICLSPEGRARISLGTFRDTDSLEEAILLAEGLDPLLVSRRLRHELSELVDRYWT